VGKAITLDGEPFTVIGVMPPTFRFPALGTDLWATPAFDLKSRSRASHYLFAVGRMRPGVTLGQAQAEMSAVAHRLEQQYPDANQGSGVTLVPIGIYGVIAFGVEQRAHEMGIRMAVGAQPGDVQRLVVGQGLWLGFVGVVIGGAAALAMSRIIAGMLYDTGTADPMTYLAVSVIFLGIAIVASYLPARRAARLDSMAALRWE
jgi:predicted lysophospholipase L1 biosynthesis ABC-type transport system permease subunit